MKAMLGKKRGMTRVFDAEGRQVPVTVIEVGPCRVVQVKTVERDGYRAVQLGTDACAERRLSKPRLGHVKKHGVSPVRRLVEVPLEEDETVEAGQTFAVEAFEGCGFVDVSGRTKGRGFQGVMKRHGMAGQPASHGHSMHRRTGSIGMREWPGRIFKNKRLPGQMGNKKVTVKSLVILSIDKENNLLYIRGAVPGANEGVIFIQKNL